MTARAMFRGVLKVGKEAVPVRMYAAVQDARIHFRLLHEEDRVPVEQRMVHAESGDVVPREDIQRGLEIEPGRFVTFTKEELDSLAPETDREMALESFVDRERIDPAWYDRPYYLGPDGDEEAYRALVEALDQTARAGICRWAMRKKHYIGAVQARDGHLILVRLRTADQVVLPTELAAPGGGKIDDKQIAMAEQLVSALEDDFDPEQFENDDRERLRLLLERKREGKPIPIARAPRKAAAGDLEDALAKSLKRAKEKRVA